MTDCKICLLIDAPDSGRVSLFNVERNHTYEVNLQEKSEHAGVKGWLILALVVGMVSLTAWILLRSIDPPWTVRTIEGSVVQSGYIQAPNRMVRYYKTEVLVRTNDGRLVSASSWRQTPPAKGAPIAIQERIGLFGTRTYVEIGE